MPSDVICAITARPGAARRALFLIVCQLWALAGCSKLIGDVIVEPAELSGDAGPNTEQEPLTPERAGCRPGVVQCQGPMLQVCEADGSGFRPLQRCASAELCDAEGQSRCIEPTCEPGVTCEGAELRQCNPDRSGFIAIETCQSAAHCDAMSGGCEDARCIPGEITCNGATLQRCNDGPSGYDQLTTCATAALCDDLVRATCGSDALGCDVSGAVCPPPVCESGQLRCSGTRLEICNAGRNGWDFVDECVTAGVCEQTRQNPAAITCLEPACDVGDVICSTGGARLMCNAERTEYSVTISQCSSPDQCTPQGCQAEQCTVGELSCNGATLQECRLTESGRATRVAVADCATRQLCDLTLTEPPTTPPSCLPPACAPGGFSCAGRQLQICNAGRSDFINRQLCATDALCQQGIGLGVCPAPCSGAACNGSILRRCNAELTALVDVENCGTAAQCDAVQGRCTDPCIPGALRCNGNALERCSSPIDGWQRLQTCETAGLCQITVERQQTTCAAPRCAPGERRCTGPELQVCNADRTDFTLELTCAAGQICDADSRQCDVCVPDATACNGNTFSRCSGNGQALSTQQCGAGLCSASGANVGCLECATPGGFRCDNLGSLFQCSSNQQQENQLDTCRTPQLCRANLGRCLDCDPPGSSRCAGDQVLGCSAQNTENVLQECESAALCLEAGASASCADSECSVGQLQCTQEGEVLSCNAGQTGFVAQSPRVFCATPALCSAAAPGGCSAPACNAGQRRCADNVVELCNAARTAFQPETTCNTTAGLECLPDGDSAGCGCAPGALRCLAGQGLSRCNGGGTAFVPVAGGFVCEGSTRLSCSGTTLVSETCEDAAHCSTAIGPSCAACVAAAECDDGSFCNGPEVCQNGSCAGAVSSPCSAATPVCLEPTDRCVECAGDDECPPGATCADNACVPDPDGGT